MYRVYCVPCTRGKVAKEKGTPHFFQILLFRVFRKKKKKVLDRSARSIKSASNVAVLGVLYHGTMVPWSVVVKL